MKKYLCITAMVLVLLSACFTSQAETDPWVFDYDNYEMKDYRGEGGAVVIPEEIDGCTVDILGLNLFNDVDTVTSLTLPSTVRQVEGNVITFCDSLTELIIPEGVQVIGDNCFMYNSALTEVVIPASVRYIGNGCFGSNDRLERVTFLGECPYFAGRALEWIADDAQIYVPDDQYDAYVAALNEAGCRSAVVPSGTNAIVYDRATDPSLFGFDPSTGTITCFNGFDVCVEVPAEIDGVPVRAIGENAFAMHRYLCVLTLPEGLETIGVSAFEYCQTLLYIEFPSTLKTIENRAFYGGYKGYELNLPGVETIGDEAFGCCSFISEPIELPDGLRTIGNSAFAGCTWLSEVYIPASVEAIGKRAFADTGMEYLVFEGLKLPQIAPDALENCVHLADIDLHTKATKQEMLDMQAMVDALGLDCRVWRIQNPEVDYVRDGLDVYKNGVLIAYTGEQSHLRPWDAYDDVTVTAVGEGAFRGSQTIDYFAVPYNDEFTTIGREAFADSTLHTVDLFDSVTTIQDGAFRNCTNLTELILPESVEFVGAEALTGCTSLKKLIVLCDPTVLPENLFDVWPEELEIYAGDNATAEQLNYLTRIAGRAFWDLVPRISEDQPTQEHTFVTMPYVPLPGADFWYDAGYARLDSYQGYELNLVLPRQIDDHPLTMIGGGMMQRACYGDNFELELPVVSMVIPENYTDIPSYAFWNCETLETVICYAPIEVLSDSLFKNCTSLREVIFVNGIGGIGNYVFDGCPNLETVYVGPYVASVGEYAFCDESGTALWSLDRCITDPALMPDIDALLESMKREPMPEPTPEPTPEPAVPVGEEGKPYFGIWNGVEMLLGSRSMKLSDFDMTMMLILLEDGRMITVDQVIDLSALSIPDDYEAPGWRVENGIAIGDGCTMTIMDDGRLMLDEDGAQMIFEYISDLPGETELGMPAVTPEPTPEPAMPVGEEGKPYFGVWNGIEMIWEGESIKMSDLEMTMMLLLLEDGRMIYTDEELDLSDLSILDGYEAPVWHVENGIAIGDGCTMTIMDNGRLMLDEDGAQMIFERISDMSPGAAAPEAPTINPESTEAPAAEPSAQGGRLEVKYVCVNADASGYTIDAAMLGGEYAMTFHEDGTLDFVVVGTAMPPLKWTTLDNGNLETDFYGSKLEIVWTETGFDMNYMDAMLMHFVPEV